MNSIPFYNVLNMFNILIYIRISGSREWKEYRKLHRQHQAPGSSKYLSPKLKAPAKAGPRSGRCLYTTSGIWLVFQINTEPVSSKRILLAIIKSHRVCDSLF